MLLNKENFKQPCNHFNSGIQRCERNNVKRIKGGVLLHFTTEVEVVRIFYILQSKILIMSPEKSQLSQTVKLSQPNIQLYINNIN